LISHNQTNRSGNVSEKRNLHPLLRGTSGKGGKGGEEKRRNEAKGREGKGKGKGKGEEKARSEKEGKDKISPKTDLWHLITTVGIDQ